jgi:hypothetical protein
VYKAIVNVLIHHSIHVNISYLYTGIHVHVIKHACQQSITYPLDLQIRKQNCEYRNKKCALMNNIIIDPIKIWSKSM